MTYRVTHVDMHHRRRRVAVRNVANRQAAIAWVEQLYGLVPTRPPTQAAPRAGPRPVPRPRAWISRAEQRGNTATNNSHIHRKPFNHKRNKLSILI